MTMKSIGDHDFKSSIREQGLTMVDFSAPWCGPCKTLLPILEQLDRELGDKVSILKLNVDDSPESASEFGVMSMPTVIFFKDGTPVDKLVGLRPPDVYRNVIRKHA